MNIFRMHILIPVDEETIQSGVLHVKRKLELELYNRNLSSEIKVIETGTMGISGSGVIMVLYPDQVYYYDVKEKDIPLIVEEHIIKGRIVDSIKHDHGEKSRACQRIPEGVCFSRTQKRIVLDKCHIVNPYDLEEVIANGGYRALEKILSENFKPEHIIEELKISGLRGRGGAGFPTWIKWNGTKNCESDQKYIICNADEGEPGTYKDRLILEGDPHKLIEAMIIGGYTAGASKGYIYIRGEYGLSISRIQKAIDDAKANGLLGRNILGTDFSFELEIKRGAGAYVCGEETALIESLEGNRGNPRVKPPYPVFSGLWSKPTIVNNVETLANIPDIIYRGGEWFKGFGTDKCSGTKVFTILGNVEYPGLIEVEMGTTLREIINSYGGGVKGGKRFKAALVGGAAGVFLSDKLLDVRMDFESLKENAAVLGSGAILVMDEDASLFDILYSTLEFFAHESCGQCSPCRIGTHHLMGIMKAIKNGEGTVKDLDDMISISETMFNTSLCPLGQSLIMPVKSAIENFREEFRVSETKTTKHRKSETQRRKQCHLM